MPNQSPNPSLEAFEEGLEKLIVAKFGLEHPHDDPSDDAWLLYTYDAHNNPIESANYTDEVAELAEAIMQQARELVAGARRDEVSMFFQKFEKHEDIGSTPSDLITGETWIDADVDEIEAYFDQRLAELEPTTKGQSMDYNQLTKDLVAELKGERVRRTDGEIADRLGISRQAYLRRRNANALTTEDITILSAWLVTSFGGGFYLNKYFKDDTTKGLVMTNKEDQDGLINFIDNPDTIAKAAEGSMEKRQAVLDSRLQAELEKSLLAAYYRGKDGKGYSDYEMKESQTALLAAFQAYVVAVKPEREDENPTDDGLPVETYGYEAAHNQALDLFETALLSGLNFKEE